MLRHGEFEESITISVSNPVGPLATILGPLWHLPAYDRAITTHSVVSSLGQGPILHQLKCMQHLIKCLFVISFHTNLRMVTYESAVLPTARLAFFLASLRGRLK